jgi:ABC-type phosphate/phosphonate transport system substrate-binding protein
MVERGLADFAVVKNRVWDKKKGSYTKIEETGKDTDENPDGVFMVSAKVAKPFQEKIKAALLGIGTEETPEAKAVKESLGITEYIVTDKKNYTHTLELLKKAGVTPAFDFKF